MGVSQVLARHHGICTYIHIVRPMGTSWVLVGHHGKKK
jgi:hypothetical protein